ncbi:MAG: hypothetical protein F8N15_04915 [Methanobacterium sp.]|nr:hypothetical protein [Methanobacterium sp.]
MNMRCRIPGCCGGASRWGAYCNAHKIRDRRHGHPEQETITKAILAPYVARVRKRIDKNDTSELWGLLEQKWSDTLADCRCYLSDVVDQGVPLTKTKRGACGELLKVAQCVAPKDVVETALAMYLLAEMEPRRFKSDRAFLFQLVRRVRGLAEVNAGEWYDHRSGRTKRVYRDLSPRTTLVMAEMLGDVFGCVGLTIARKEVEEIEGRSWMKQRTHAALEALV